MKSTINQIKSATSAKEVRQMLANNTPEARLVFLDNAIKQLNKEIELDIEATHTDMAIFKMSQVVMLEDEKHIVERVVSRSVVMSIVKEVYARHDL